MAYVQPVDPAIKDPTKASLPIAQNAALADLNTRVSGISTVILPNGSFEDDLNTDGEPDVWTITNEGTGATHELDTTTSADGLKSLKCTVNATGGYVSAVNDTRLPVYPGARVEVPFWYKSTVATCRVRVNVVWRNAAESVISEVSAFDESTNLLSAWTPISGYLSQVVAPANAAWMDIKVIAGDGTVAGVVHFDSVRPFIYHGYVPVDMSDTDAILSTDTDANQIITLPSNIVGEEHPVGAVVYMELTWSVTGVQTVQLRDPDDTQVRFYVSRDSATFGNPSVYEHCDTIIDDIKRFEFNESGSGNLTVVRIILKGYYV
jgi:hypothetical protein